MEQINTLLTSVVITVLLLAVLVVIVSMVFYIISVINKETINNRRETMRISRQYQAEIAIPTLRALYHCLDADVRSLKSKAQTETHEPQKTKILKE